MKAKGILITGAIFMALAVAFGAFGAHIIQDLLPHGRYEVYQTAVEYHFYHSLGLLILGAVCLELEPSKWLQWSGYSLIAGILIFSGSLYLLTLTDTGWFGAITPIGGVAFIIGWILFIAGILKSEKINRRLVL